MNDNEVLTNDVRQLQQERAKLLHKVHALALETEQLRSERDEILDEKRRESEDYIAQIEANEKNLLSYKRFIDEQTHEREIERDEFNKELVCLIEKLKEKDKIEGKLKSKIEEMEIQINSLIDEKNYHEKQWREIQSQHKTAIQEINELKSIISQMEKDNEKLTQSERKLQTKINDLNDALDFQLKLNESSQNDALTNSILEKIALKAQKIQNTISCFEGESESEDASFEYSFNDVRILSDKLNSLNECIDKLLIQNQNLKKELTAAKQNTNLMAAKQNTNSSNEEILKEKQVLEKNLMEIMRSNEVLQQELNTKHLQLSALKSRMESSLDSNTLKCLVNEMQNKLLSEEQKCLNLDHQITLLKQQLDDNNSKTVHFIEEINKLKTALHNVDNEKVLLMRQNEELRSRVSSNELINASFKQKLEEKSFNSKELHEEIETKNTQLKLIETKNSNLIEENQEIRLKLIAAEKNFDNLKKQFSLELNKNVTLTEETNTLKYRLQLVESEKECLIKENAMLRSKLSAADEIINVFKEQIEQANKRVSHLNDVIEKLKRRIKLLEFENNSKENELRTRFNSQFNSHHKNRAVHSAKEWEDEEKCNRNECKIEKLICKRIRSQRNALYYQKKYLLHVLGGFQLTEQATLALLATMNVSS